MRQRDEYYHSCFAYSNGNLCRIYNHPFALPDPLAEQRHFWIATASPKNLNIIIKQQEPRNGEQEEEEEHSATTTTNLDQLVKRMARMKLMSLKASCQCAVIEAKMFAECDFLRPATTADTAAPTYRSRRGGRRAKNSGGPATWIQNNKNETMMMIAERSEDVNQNNNLRLPFHFYDNRHHHYADGNNNNNNKNNDDGLYLLPSSLLS
jgi:hypothetical protein